MALSSNFLRTIRETFGEAGSIWLGQLPDIISQCERRWSLEVELPFEELSYNYVAPARRSDGKELVLKVGVPRDELTSEADALRYYDGRGSVRLLDADPDLGVLLLERLIPGSMLAKLCSEDDEQATLIAAGVMRQLWRPVTEDHPFIKIEEWFEGLNRLRQEFNGGTGPFPADLVQTAETLYAELIRSAGETVLLHGDLHHFNILTATRQPWLAIDPKGVVGEAAYDVGALLRNPGPDIQRWANLGRILQRRVDVLAEALDLEHRRILGWGIAQTVLSAWWSYEDNDEDWRDLLPIAETMATLIF
ncbi:MAG: phosphotransferase [Anaerolineaceae bacterium]|nr:MAG: phosphotransferase [Anaerolineaceae bacterium]